MGWCGHSIYSGDETQSRHFDFIKWSGIRVSENQVMDWMTVNKTKLPKEFIPFFIKGLPRVIKRMPRKIIKGVWDSIGHDDDRAIEWQMLLALCMDNNIKPPKTVYRMGMEATGFLMKDHAADFRNPSLRRKNLKRFVDKAKKMFFDI